MGHRELRLARRMLAGDERALDEFFEGYLPGLYRFAMARMNRDSDGAADVVQATLCAAISKLGTYRGEAALLTWLCTFCRHEISAFYRRASRQPATVELVEDNPEIGAALESLWALEASGPEDAAQRAEIKRIVHVTLDHLPRSYAEALEWKYIEGLPVKEIAAKLGVSPKAAESLLSRARGAFREAFSTLTRSRFLWERRLPETP